ncbi:hypothetical protein Q7P37_004596 [Cladosporium fusiforme]
MAQQQQPDLQAILATLAQYSQPATLQPPQLPQSQHTEQHENTAPVSTAQDNASAISHNATIEAMPTDPRLRNRPQSRSTTPSQPPPQSQIQPQPPSIIDPATITVWQDGLRCVTKIAAQNKMFEASIRRMMKDQRAHEMRWYTERQTLKQAQTSRSSSAAKVSSILQSLNQGAAGPAAEPQSEEEKEAELTRFDRKVYAAQQSMEMAMTAELKGLGVPFFGTSVDLIVPEEQKPPHAGPLAGRPKWSVPVTETELLDLKRQMVGHLEVLYRD